MPCISHPIAPSAGSCFGLLATLVAAMSITAVAVQPDLVEGLRSAIRATA
ncbi:MULTISPECIES: hypothetical protein [unclassified Pseudomonas]|nr:MULTISPECIES: hypothetical protein [unclassified Pseudomonas]